MQPKPDINTNVLLAAFSPSSQLRLTPYLEPVICKQGQWLQDTHEKLRYVYFPVDTLVAVVGVLSNSKTTALNLVGQEGMLGSTVLLGSRLSHHRTLVQQAGRAYRLPSGLFKEVVSQDNALQLHLLRYLHRQLLSIAQSAICYRHHYLEQQVCHWLLLSLDRVKGSGLYLTHDFMANLLGVRREGVTLVAGKLQQREIITYKRGHIKILHRAGLEQLSCECYQTAHRLVL